MAISYIAAGMIVLVIHLSEIPAAFAPIVKVLLLDMPRRVVLVAPWFALALRQAARGIFSNEAGWVVRRLHTLRREPMIRFVKALSRCLAPSLTLSVSAPSPVWL